MYSAAVITGQRRAVAQPEESGESCVEEHGQVDRERRETHQGDGEGPQKDRDDGAVRSRPQGCERHQGAITRVTAVQSVSSATPKTSV